MRLHFHSSAFILTIILLMSSCTTRSRHQSVPTAGDTLRFEYAENISATTYKDYTLVDIRNPWDTLKILHSYILIDKDKKDVPVMHEGTIVRTPIDKAIVYSSVHSSLFIGLDALHKIAGVCDLRYMNLPEITKGCEQGIIKDCGNSMNPDIETIIDTRPDAIMLSPFENSGGYGKIEKLNIPIIECADYMESSPLARAEWMKFYGMLIGQEAKADSLFLNISTEYRQLSAKASAKQNKPTVLCELKNGAAWYVPTGKSTTGQLIADAGGNYLFSHLKGFGAVPLSPETVIDQAHLADVWFIKYGSTTGKTYQDIAGEYTPYAGFKAFQTKNIYGCNTFVSPFYEESPFHPELLLKDMIKILHPDLLQDYEPRYYYRIKD